MKSKNNIQGNAGHPAFPKFVWKYFDIELSADLTESSKLFLVILMSSDLNTKFWVKPRMATMVIWAIILTDYNGSDGGNDPDPGGDQLPTASNCARPISLILESGHRSSGR